MDRTRTDHRSEAGDGLADLVAERSGVVLGLGRVAVGHRAGQQLMVGQRLVLRVRGLEAQARDYIREHAPKAYSRELVEVILRSSQLKLPRLPWPADVPEGVCCTCDWPSLLSRWSEK